MTPISEISSSATQILHPGLLGARGSLQPLAPPPPIPPKFIPPSLDPNWTKLAQTSSEKAISLVLSRHQDGYGILTSDIILVRPLSLSLNLYWMSSLIDEADES